MLPTLNQTTRRLTRHTLRFLLFVTVPVLLLFTIWWTTQMKTAGPAVAFADDKAQPADAGKGAAGADRRDKPGTATKSPGAAVEIEYLPRPSRFEEKFLAALEKPVHVEFLDLQLEDCLTYLKEAADIPIWLDKQTLTDEGVALDQPITLKLKDARLESILHLLLKPVQLTFVPEDDVMVVTTHAKAGENLITRTYPVRDLYQGRSQLEAHGTPHKPVASPAGTAQATANGLPPTTQKPVAVAVGAAPSPAKDAEGAGDAAKGGDKGAESKPAQPVARVKYADLEEAITNTIEPDSWEDLSGPGTYTYVKETGCIVIRQTWAVHRQILQLLRDLREGKHLAPGGVKK